MIKLSNNTNDQTIELSQEAPDGQINIDILDDKGDIDYYFTIEPDTLLAFLNNYQQANNII